MSSMHGRKNDMDDREDLLSTVPIPDILLATRSMHHSSILVPLLLNLRTRFLLRGRAITFHVMKFIINFIKILIKS
jgi:hypothetical protein